MGKGAEIMAAIPFTQYLKPNGKKVSVVIDMDEDTEAQAKILLDNGYHFAVEILNNGIVSITCENDEDVISIELCENGPKIPDIVRKLITTAKERMESTK